MRGRLSAIRYRPWQSLVLLCLSAVVAGTAILAPLYDRALQQAMVSSLISQASPDIASVSVRSAGRIDDLGASEPFSTSRLILDFPQSVRPYFEDPITTFATSVFALDPAHANPVGALMNRDGMCDHVSFETGSCPTHRKQIAISTDDAQVFGWSVGDSVRAMESSPLLDPPTAAHIATMKVVGIYTTDPEDRYWVSRAPVGKAGLVDADGATQHDGWLTAPETFYGAVVDPPDEGERWPNWVVPERTVDLLLDRDKVGVDEMFALADPVQNFVNHPADTSSWGSGATAENVSGIPALTSRAETGRDHAHQLVPLFVIQLALLAALTLWLVLGAAVEQRRPEVAVVRLRGGDARSCRRLLVGELGPPILLGWLLGLVLAAAALLLIGRQWLDPDLDLEITPLVLVTAGAVLVIEVLMLLAATWSAVRANATDLLRRVRPRTGWALSSGPAIIVVMCGAAFIATASGSLSGWVATAAPTLLAISVGLVLGFLLGPVAGGLGRRLLGRGRLVAGLGLLQLGRRHGMRTAITTIVAAAALLAFAVNALGVGERNRDELARATVGAPTVLLTAGGADLASVRAAVSELDPSGGSATVAVTATAAGGITTMAVVPDEYARVAAFEHPEAAREVATALRPSGPEPLEVRGTQLVLDGEWHVGRSTVPSAGEELPFDLDAVVVRPGREAVQVPLQAGTAHGAAATWSTEELPCTKGCVLTALAVNNRTDADLRATVVVRSITVGGTPVALGDQDDWTDATPHDNGTIQVGDVVEGVAFKVVASHGFDAWLGHLSVPERISAVTSGTLPPDSVDDDFVSVGLDTINRDMHQVATESYLPGAPADTALVDLDVLERDGADVDPAARIRVYLGDSISADEATQMLGDHGVSVDTVTTIEGAKDDYQHSAPAWALQLGVVAAGVAALLAALVLAISFITSWRLRSADSLAMRLNGVSRRRATVVALLETVPLVLLSTAIGLVCGVVGSRIALPDLPFFDVPPALPVEDLHTSWSTVILTGAGLLAALAALAVLTSLRLGRLSLSHASEEA